MNIATKIADRSPEVAATHAGRLQMPSSSNTTKIGIEAASAEAPTLPNKGV
jgi:hypothetical protein